jgi:manganese/iron transport system permease protein
MLESLIEPLQYGFMQRALFIAVLVGIVCATVGS